MATLGAITEFDFVPGRKIAGKYEIIARVGSGYEGEVYLIAETATGIERAAKFFFPQRNPQNVNARRYAQKLHKLRHCDILIQYHHQEKVKFKTYEIACLISDFVEGDLLSDILRRAKGNRLQVYEAVHLLYALVVGVEKIHAVGEYHGDLHTENVFVQKYGVGFNVKLIDLFHHKDTKVQNMQFDILNLIRIFYDSLGGAKHYAQLPREVKGIICGLRKTAILKKFRTIAKLRQHLESIQWEM